MTHIPAIDIEEKWEGETLAIRATAGPYICYRYVPGYQLTQAKADIIRATKFRLVTDLASRILKDTE